MHHFWGIRQGTHLMLLEDEARHARSVLRLDSGHLIRVLDGHGSAWEGALQFHGKREAFVADAQELPEYGAVSGHFHLFIAPTKNIDRTEWMLEKAVELGVHAITLLECSRSERRHLKLERLERVMQAACKQSQKGRLPLLEGPLGFQESVVTCRAQNKGLAALIDGRESAYLPERIRQHRENSWAVWIGPEGDFTPDEVDFAALHDVHLVHLGPHRLRTETAGLYAVAAYAQR